MNCSTCNREIKKALCCEGWCKDCVRSEWNPQGEVMALYCKAHRLNVLNDEHCRDWMTEDK